MSKLSELKPVEQQVTQWLSRMGWELRTPEEMKAYSRPLGNPVVEKILREKVAELNPGVSPTARDNAMGILLNQIKNPVPIEGNEKFLNLLVSGANVTDARLGDITVRFVDFQHIRNNSFIVTNQYTVRSAFEVRTDIVLLVNGIPLVPIEAKQCAKRGTNWLEGVRQFSTYAQRADNLFMCHLFGVACNGRVAKYGIPGASASYFNEWKDTILDTTQENPILAPDNNLCQTYRDETDGLWHFNVERLPNGEVLEKMKRTIVGLLQPARVLDILRNFIVFERSNESNAIIKKVARYQQLRAANKIVERVENTENKTGVIWHTQGSGKSLTMIYTAGKLRTSDKLHDPTVFIILDRKELREQLGGTFDDCHFPNVRPVANIGDLKAIIKNKPAGVFVCTIQKFRELGDICDNRANVIVLIDEAHRTEYGDFQMELRAVLPNASRFAFTGTPVPKTHQEFGIRKENTFEKYLDKYSIQDAIDDGATKPVLYTFGPMEWQLDKEKLAAGYAEITADLDDDQKRQVEQRVQPWKTFLKHPDRIAVIAKDIADDYRAQLEPQGYKAQVVACDKEACVLYYNELLKYFDKSEIQIIFSTGQYDTSERFEMFSPFYLDDETRRTYVKQFKRRITEEEKANGNNLKIFIVCNMLLTGFDAPIEQTMYLDSPLRDHNLLQAIARTNRPYDDKVSKLSKEFGRVVDYVGVFQNYKEALNYDPEDIGEFQDVDSLAKTFPAVLEKAMSYFSEVKLEDSYECTIALLRVLSGIDQGKFENAFHNTVQLWEAISPNPVIRPYRERYLWLLTIYELYLEEFKRTLFEADIYAMKTRELIRESAKLLNFKGHLPEIAIDSDYLEKLKETKLSPEDKAEKIIRDIETVIRLNENNSAVYVEFQQRLDELIRQKREESQAIEDILLKLSALYAEIDDVASLPQRMGFDDKGSFELFTILTNRFSGIDKPLAKEFVTESTHQLKAKIYLGWQEIFQDVNRFKFDLQLLSVSDKFAPLHLDLADNDELTNELMNAMIKFYSIN